MTISKSNYLILKAAALYAAKIEKEIFEDRVKNAIETTETAAAEASKKTSQYIMERRKKDPLYCR